MILSGGLTAENVGDAIAAVHPYAVDVASATEDLAHPPDKDHDKLHAFAAAVAASADPRPAEAAASAEAEAEAEAEAV